jgi:hypothetical protein
MGLFAQTQIAKCAVETLFEDARGWEVVKPSQPSIARR